MSNLDKIRILGIMAHIDAGKTTTTERFLFITGKSYKMGEVHEGTATMDWMLQEQERGITITAAATTFLWEDTTIHLMDTPGHVDFTIEVERSLRVLDGVIALFDASQGVEPQSETVWRQADRYGVSRIAFLNKMDKVGASVDLCLNSMRERLLTQPLLLQLPFFEVKGSTEVFQGIFDLISEEFLLWGDDKDVAFKTLPIPKEFQEEVEAARIEMIEALSDVDDEIASAYLSEEAITPEVLKKAIRRACIHRTLTPVLLGSSFKNKGVQPLLNAASDYLPSPMDFKEWRGSQAVWDNAEENPLLEEVRTSSVEDKFSGVIFKMMLDPFVGMLFFVRIYSGSFRLGQALWNGNRRKREKPLKIFSMHANSRQEKDQAQAGEIIALVGLKFSQTGDTLSFEDSPIIYPSIPFPEPVVSVIVEPENSQDSDKLSAQLQRFSLEDPSMKISQNGETGQMMISGMGELHLQIIIDRLNREFKIPTQMGKPQVSYRESINQSVTETETYCKPGTKVEVTVTLKIEPQIALESSVDISKIPLLKDTLKDALNVGPLLGYPVVNVKCTVLKVETQPPGLPPEEVSLKIASVEALRQALQKAKPKLMEPIMDVEITVPDEFSGAVIADVQSRRGQIEDVQSQRSLCTIKSKIPLGETFGYETDLRSLSQGRASSSAKLATYHPLPLGLQQKILGQ